MTQTTRRKKPDYLLMQAAAAGAGSDFLSAATASARLLVFGARLWHLHRGLRALAAPSCSAHCAPYSWRTQNWVFRSCCGEYESIRVCVGRGSVRRVRWVVLLEVGRRASYETALEPSDTYPFGSLRGVSVKVTFCRQLNRRTFFNKPADSQISLRTRVPDLLSPRLETLGHTYIDV